MPCLILNIRPVIVPGSMCPLGVLEEENACEVLELVKC